MIPSANSCRTHDKMKTDLESFFVPIYSVMFFCSVVLNSLLLYVVVRKEHFLHEKRAFHKLFQALIALDLVISLLILPQILVKIFTLDHQVLISIDLFLAIRDFAISGQMIILVLIALDRLLAFLVPLGNYWRLDNVRNILYSTLSTLGAFYVSRFVLLNVDLECVLKRRIDGYAKMMIGLSGGVFMVSTFLMYLALFVLLCKRQVRRQRLSFQSLQILKINQDQNSTSLDGRTPMFQGSPSRSRSRSRLSLTRGTLGQRIGSIKFAKVLFGVNILMITSYLPGILYNARLISFPSYSVYYLFFLHALGDPILFFLTRPELKNGVVSIFKSRDFVF